MLATVKVFISHKQQVVKVLHGADIEYFQHCSKFYWTVLV